MRDFNEHTATAAVLERMSGCSDARLKQIMTSVVTHLHAVVREVEPTMDEWMAARSASSPRPARNATTSGRSSFSFSDTLGALDAGRRDQTTANRRVRPS